MDDPNPQLESGSQLPLAPRGSEAGQLAPSPPLPIVHRIFIGRDGLRVLWRLVLYLLMAVAIGIVLLAITVHAWHPQGAGKLWQGLISEGELVLAAMLPAFIMGAIEKRPFGAYGLPRAQAFGRDFWAGSLWGMAALTVLLSIMHGVHVFDFGTLALHGVRIARFAAFYAALFLLVGLFEEFLVRGYVQFSLAHGIGFWPSALVLSAAFGALHLGNSGEAWIGIVAAGLISLFFCLTLYRTSTLWWAVGFHFSWDWGETYLYSVPDSGQVSPGHLLNSSFHGAWWLTGGSVGPEGSVLVLVLIGALWIVFSHVYPERKWSSEGWQGRAVAIRSLPVTGD